MDDEDKKDPARRVDRHAGRRLRLRRRQLGRSQARLGQALRVSFQQIQKDERGANQLTATRLHDLSEALGVPIGYFFEGLSSSTGGALELWGDGALLSRDVLGAADSNACAVAVTAIRSPKLRREILKLVKALSEAE
ncbi:helix-turn-helix domain-containing protein [Caulobacter segnis]|uniref:helix-turn-helix domain-containing protein n=1 Tax=Caulobacter segnis TaxID=88688 RepID=UPI0026D277FB|nr:helix-turn-helix transcriptional regulator [Caulobacter segnis]